VPEAELLPQEAVAFLFEKIVFEQTAYDKARSKTGQIHQKHKAQKHLITKGNQQPSFHETPPGL